MENFKCKICTNGWKTSDKIGMIESIDILSLDGTDTTTDLCRHGVMVEVDECGTFVEEYQMFYFQAKNILDAQKVAIEHYMKHDLDVVDKTVLAYYFERLFGLSELLNDDKETAARKIAEYIKAGK